MVGFCMVIGWDMFHLLPTLFRPVSKPFYPKVRLAFSIWPDDDKQKSRWRPSIARRRKGSPSLRQNDRDLFLATERALTGDNAKRLGLIEQESRVTKEDTNVVVNVKPEKETVAERRSASASLLAKTNSPCTPLLIHDVSPALPVLGKSLLS